MPKPGTQKRIAEELGVSIMTVSKALSYIKKSKVVFCGCDMIAVGAMKCIRDHLYTDRDRAGNYCS